MFENPPNIIGIRIMLNLEWMGELSLSRWISYNEPLNE